MQEDIVEECKKHGIALTAYSPLGSDASPLLTNPIVEKIAKKYNVSPANILISLQANRPQVTGRYPLSFSDDLNICLPWCHHAVIPKSVTPSRIDQNAKIVDLTEEDVKELASIEKENHLRVCKPYWTGWGNIGFPDLE